MNRLFFILLLSISLASPAIASEESCYSANEIVGASYFISSSDKPDEGREITVLRQTPRRLIYLAPTEHFTQVYERYSDRLVKLIEYFDLEAIGVEHEPADSKAPRDWDSMYQIFPASKLGGLKQVGESRYHCLKAVSYEGDDNGTRVVVTYLPEVSLPASIKRQAKTGSKTWELRRLVKERAEIDQVLARIETYTTYDFADLGDNEQEEFFRKSRYLQYKLGHDH
jgi:hypothetical protein